MSSGRAITFIFLSSAIMLGALLMQNATQPDPDKVEGADAAINAPVDPNASADQDDQTEAGKSDGDKGEKQPTSGNAEAAEQGAGDAAVNTPEASPNGETAAVNGITAPALVQDEFVKLGSLNTDGSDRYLVTINRKAGTVHQLELNARNAKGRFRYRDLVFAGGYLGSTNYRSTSKGLEVIAVGKGTPAELAGLQVGDVLQSFADEPMVSEHDIHNWLDKNTKPGQTLTFKVNRNGQSVQLNATLTQKPISIIRPEGDLVDPDFDYPESFVLSLLKPQTYLERAWPDVDAGMREQLWEVTEGSTAQMVELKYTVSEETLKALGLPGPLTVYKRFKLPTVTEDDRLKLDTRSFHVGLEIEIQNDSEEVAELAYELDGPTGLTAETWWYANKIHGRQTAIGYIAGARDIVGSTLDNSYVFFGCPEIVKDASRASGPVPQYVCDPFDTDPNARQLSFIGVDSHYFNVSVIPTSGGAPTILTVNSATAFPNNRRGRLPEIPTNSRLQKLVDCTFQMVAPATVPAKGSFRQSFDIFCGPKDPAVLDDYGLDDTRTFGWFSWCSYVLLWILHGLYWITFQTSYGLAIILLTVMVRCLMIPFSRKAALNAQMMQHLAPQIKEISDKYKDDMEKRAKAQQELYKKHNFNPLGGCFMMFFQLPIFYGLYKGLNVDIALRDQPLIPGMSWCSNLAAPDQLLYWKDWMPAWLGDETGYLGPYLNILPLATMVLFIVQQKLFTPPATDDQQKFMQKMMTFMMLFLGIMFFKVPSGLCIYFITSSLWGIIERKLLPKPVLDTARFGDSEKPAKSAREQRKEDAAEATHREELEARKKRNSERKKKLKKRNN